MTSTDAPIVTDVKRHSGIAGQFTVTATVTYPGEASTPVTFTGSIYGGPIVMHTPGTGELFVSGDVTDRIGHQLSPEWVRAFFAPRNA